MRLRPAADEIGPGMLFLRPRACSGARPASCEGYACTAMPAAGPAFGRLISPPQAQGERGVVGGDGIQAEGEAMADRRLVIPAPGTDREAGGAEALDRSGV